MFSVNKRKKYEQKLDTVHSIYCLSTYGPSFGGGHDLHLRIGSPDQSYSNLGHSYKCDYVYGSQDAKNEIVGTYKFAIDDCEIFGIIKNPSS